jgi:hypothetical protein
MESSQTEPCRRPRNQLFQLHFRLFIRRNIHTPLCIGAKTCDVSLAGVRNGTRFSGISLSLLRPMATVGGSLLCHAVHARAGILTSRRSGRLVFVVVCCALADCRETRGQSQASSHRSLDDTRINANRCKAAGLAQMTAQVLPCHGATRVDGEGSSRTSPPPIFGSGTRTVVTETCML